MEFFLKLVGAFIAGAITVFIAAILMAYPTMWLVNDLFTPATLTVLFGVSSLTFWKALALDILCGILFTSSSSSSKS